MMLEPRRGPSALIVDDDEATRAIFQIALKDEGFDVETAADASSASRIARRRDFDLWFIDQYLGHELGTDLLLGFRNKSSKAKVVAMSAFLTSQLVVEFMKLGAFDVLEKPIDLHTFVGTAWRAYGSRVSSWVPDERADTDGASEGSASSAERWAGHVIKGSCSNGDFRTLELWAKHLAVSYSTLCASCRIIGIRPHDARDFARVLRAIRRCLATRSAPAAFLDVNDERTLETLVQKAGVDLRSIPRHSILDEFLHRQRFIAPDNLGFQIVRSILASPSRGNPL